MPFNLANHLLAVARFEREDGDAVMNTFYFDTVGGGGSDDVVNRLNAFYIGVPNQPTLPVARMLSPRITSLTYYIRAANAAPGIPGEELAQPTFVRTAAGVGELMADAAVCASYRSGSPYTARRRGRIYLGPLAGDVLDTTNGLIKTDFRNALATACEGLASESLADPVRWVIASRAGNTSSRVQEGYVDEHFDTQRRRDPGAEFFGRRPSTWDIAA